MIRRSHFVTIRLRAVVTPKAFQPEFADRIATQGEIKERNVAEILEHI